MTLECSTFAILTDFVLLGNDVAPRRALPTYRPSRTAVLEDGVSSSGGEKYNNMRRLRLTDQGGVPIRAILCRTLVACMCAEMPV